MQKKIKLFLMFTALAMIAAIFQEAHAAGAYATMDEVYCDTRDIVTGNVGTIIGFGFAFAGLLMLLLKGSNYGIFMIIIGISVTAFPGLLNSFIEGMSVASSETPVMDIGTCNDEGELPSATSPDRNPVHGIIRVPEGKAARDYTIECRGGTCDPPPCDMSAGAC